MTFSRSLFKTLAVVLALALPTALTISSADARAGGGFSSGSRGSRTYSAPPSTTTAPGSTSQFNRTYTQPGAGMNSAAAAPARGGLFGRAGGFMGGLAAGFLGAGLLGEVQAAWSNEDVAKLHTLATPEMVSYFEQDLTQNRARNVVNKVTNVKLLQGDLAEAWREGETDYATVALRFALTDKTLDRNTGAVVAGSEQPGEATEIWTFARRPGAGWELSAIQQTN